MALNHRCTHMFGMGEDRQVYKNGRLVAIETTWRKPSKHTYNKYGHIWSHKRRRDRHKVRNRSLKESYERGVHERNVFLDSDIA